MGIAALVIGIVALIVGLVPGCGVFLGIPLAVVGLVLGIIEIVTKSKKGEPKKQGVIGVVLCGVAIVVSILSTTVLALIRMGMMDSESAAMRAAAADEAAALRVLAMEDEALRPAETDEPIPVEVTIEKPAGETTGEGTGE